MAEDIEDLRKALAVKPLPKGCKTMSLEQAFRESGISPKQARRWVIGPEEEDDGSQNSAVR